MFDKNAVYLALIVCSAVSLLLIGLSVPLAQGKIARNNWYGFRTPKTLSDDEIWYPVNRAAAINFIYAGIFILLAAVILFFVKDLITDYSTVLVMVIVTMVSIIAAVIKSFVFLSGFGAKGRNEI